MDSSNGDRKSEADARAPLRILLVEDNAFVREQTAEMLASDGREVVACETAEQAWLEFERLPSDVLITDLSLPYMSGMELARRVLAKRPTAWVVIASGYSLPIEPGKLGPNVRFLRKPFETQEIEVLLQGARAMADRTRSP